MIVETKILDSAKSKLVEQLRDMKLWDTEISILARSLTPEQAIGTPGRRDFPIIIGRERMLEATIFNSKGQAFTDSRKEFIGTLKQVFDLPLDSNANRAIFVATMNAILHHFKKADRTVHCKDDEPEKCALEMADFIHRNFHPDNIALIGLNPAVAEALVNKFGSENILISDLDAKNIGAEKFDVKILDGNNQNEDSIRKCDFVLITGTTIVNGTFDEIMRIVKKYGKNYITYGVTSAGICSLFDIPRICPYSHSF
ncbi:hypothetical protein J7L68_01720 [bacterium]|nr:hypothetical protein [bacterium]